MPALTAPRQRVHIVDGVDLNPYTRTQEPISGVLANGRPGVKGQS